MSDRLKEMTIEERTEQIQQEAHNLTIRVKNLKARLELIERNIANIVDNVYYYEGNSDMEFLNNLLGQIESYKLMKIFQ